MSIANPPATTTTTTTTTLLLIVILLLVLYYYVVVFRLLLLIVVVILIFCYDASRGFSSLMIPSLPENTENTIPTLRRNEDPCLYVLNSILNCTGALAMT